MGARLEASTPQREAPYIAVALTRPSPLHHTHPTSPRIGHPPFAIRHPPSAIRHLPSAIRHLPSAIFHPSFAIRHLPSVICHPHICHPPFPVPRSAFRILRSEPSRNQNHGQISNIFS